MMLLAKKPIMIDYVVNFCYELSTIFITGDNPMNFVFSKLSPKLQCGKTLKFKL
jgi:hypothetical protein